MSSLHKKRYRTYLLDHHSPEFSCITLDKMDFEQYEKFYENANIDSLMLYCKDHWGSSWYPSKVDGARMHPALKGVDYVGKVREICKKKDIEFIAYYCFEYDSGNASRHPEWRVVDPTGKPVIRDDAYAKWSLDCMQTGYREHSMQQLEEIVTNYHPDALFLDIFGSSLCYCPNCRKAFREKMGYDLPETDLDIEVHLHDINKFLADRSVELLTEVRTRLKAIDPTLAITINFASHYPVEVRQLLDYQFAEPVLQDNWFSALFTRDTAKGRYPIMMPGEFSAVYNYPTKERYITDLSEIAAQGCRVGMYSGAQHVDGSLDMKESELLGAAFAEIRNMHPFLDGARPVRYVGIIQSDICNEIEPGEFKPDAILRLKHSGPHMRALLGAMKLCEYCCIPYTVIPEKELDDLKDYKVLILPDLYVVSDTVKEQLTAFVKNGGTVISSGKSGLYTDDLAMGNANKLADLFGAEFVAHNTDYTSNDWSAYVRVEEGAHWLMSNKTTPPISNNFIETRLTTGKKLASLVMPCVKCDDSHWINWWCPPPASHATELPAVVMNKIGEGTAYYCAFDFFTMAADETYQICRELFTGFMSTVAQAPAQVVADAPDMVRNAYTIRKDGTCNLHQISQIPKRFNGKACTIPAGTLVLPRNSNTAPQISLVYPENRVLTPVATERGWEVELPALKLQQIIQFKE